MDESLYLKWNNHAATVLENLSYIKVKEKYCDATIACQGTYFSVHRFVLSMCSDYFDEIFERIRSQNPCIIMKDIAPKEMEALLNYMYLGEMNAIQKDLPNIIAAAEALKIKGLAVSDDLFSKNHIKNNNRAKSAKKRKCSESSIQNAEPVEENLNFTDDADMNHDMDPNVIGKCEAVINQNSTSHASDEIEEEFDDNQPFTGSPDPSTIKAESSLTEEQDTSNKNDETPEVSQPDTLSKDQQKKKKRPFRIKLSVNKHKCAFCSYKCDRKSLLKRHTIAKHSLERPFQCQMCPSNFSHKQNLRRHMISHTGEYRFECDHCGKKFADNYRLKRHLNNKTKCYEMTENSVIDYSC